MKRKMRRKRFVSDRSIRKIRRRYQNLAVEFGDSDSVIFEEIAREFEISRATVRSIVLKINYYKEEGKVMLIRDT